MGTKEKLMRYADFKGFTAYKITKILGLPNGSLKSGKEFGADKIKLIRDNCHDLNMNWLLFDEGEMIVNHDNGINETAEIYQKQPNSIENEVRKIVNDENKELLNQIEDISVKVDALLVINKIDEELLDSKFSALVKELRNRNRVK